MTKEFTLSGRQLEIVERLRKGQPVKQISYELGLSIHTVKDYMRRIYYKARVHSARELLYELPPRNQHGARPTSADPLLRTADTRCYEARILCDHLRVTIAQFRSLKREIRAARRERHGIIERQYTAQ